MIEVRVVVDLSDRVMAVLTAIRDGSTIGFTPKKAEPEQSAVEEAISSLNLSEEDTVKLKEEMAKQEAIVKEAKENAKAKTEKPKDVKPKDEKPKDEKPEDKKSNLKITDLRALLRVKVNNDDNREKLVKKLNSYEASSVSNLDKKYYDEFYAYMQTLP